MTSPLQVVIKRAYLPPGPEDGTRVLVDRLWPRGLRKIDATIDLWCKDIAPSPALRQWFDHDPAHWAEFRLSYWAELQVNTAPVSQLRQLAAQTRLTLLYAAHDEVHNHALVLRDFLLGMLAAVDAHQLP